VGDKWETSGRQVGDKWETSGRQVANAETWWNRIPVYAELRKKGAEGDTGRHAGDKRETSGRQAGDKRETRT